MHGKEYRMNSIAKAKKKNLSYLPRNRKENGIIKDLSVGQNITISIINQLRKGLLCDHKKDRKIKEYPV